MYYAKAYWNEAGNSLLFFYVANVDNKMTLHWNIPNCAGTLATELQFWPNYQGHGKL
jgi:hypothetical protein